MFGTTCPCCHGPLSPTCSLCRGAPDPGITIEAIARGIHHVDVATGGTAAASVDLLDILRRP